MARYESIAKEANKIVVTLVNQLKTHATSPEEVEQFTEQLLRLYNLGIRTSPRACQSIVREKAVRIAATSLPVVVGMKKVQLPNFRSYNALTITPKNSGVVTTLDDTEDTDE